MYRKILSLFLSFALVLTLVSCYSLSDDDSKVVDIVTETDDTITSQVEAEGVEVRCTYEKSSNQYYLYIDDNQCNINVEIEDDKAFVWLDSNDIDPTAVTGQSAALVATAGYWAPYVVAALKLAVSAVIFKVAATQVYYSLDLLATTLKGIRYGSITKNDVKTKSIAQVRAIDVVATAKKSNANYYYLAYLYNGMVMIGNQLTFYQAKTRLISGGDVFASTKAAAKVVANSASVTGQAKFESGHAGSCEAFPHYHPTGRRWIANRNHMPHCWFPG